MKLLDKILLLLALVSLVATTACDGGSSADGTKAPDTPSGIAVVTAKGGSATVSWTGNTNSGSYTVLYNTEDSTTTGSPLKEEDTSSGASITDLTIGETYYFWIVPVTGDDVEQTPVASPNNSSGGYTMPDYDDPDTPADLQVTVDTSGNLTVSWTGNKNDGVYTAYADTNQNLSDGTSGSVDEYTYNPGERHYYTISGLTPGNSYYICAVPKKQDSTELSPVWYDSGSQVKIDIPADIPTNVTAVIDGSGDIEVTWTGNKNDGIYYIQYGDTLSCSSGQYKDVASPYTISDMPTGTWYISVLPGTDTTTSDKVLANTGTPISNWTPHLVKEKIAGTITQLIESDSEYIYYTDNSKNLGIIDIRGITDFSTATLTPVTQLVSSDYYLDGMAVAGSQVYFALRADGATVQTSSEMARIIITKSASAPSLAAPSLYDFDLFKTGSADGHRGTAVITDGTYIYLTVHDNNGTYPNEDYLASFHPATSTWRDYTIAGEDTFYPGLTVAGDTLYHTSNRYITTFDITDPDNLGTKVQNSIGTLGLKGCVIVQGDYIFTTNQINTVTIFNTPDFSEAATINVTASDIAISGTTLCITNSSITSEGFAMIDITDPQNPGTIRWIQSGTDTTNDYDKKASQVTIQDKYAFVTTPTGISIIQLSQ